MKKGYYIFFGKSNSCGVSKKVNMQLKELEKYFLVELINVPKIERGIIKRIWGLFFWVSNNYNYDKLLMLLMNPSFLYIRYYLSDKKFILFLKKVKERYPNCKIVIELAAYPYDKEYRHSINYLFFLKDIYYRKKLKQYIDRFVVYVESKEVWGVPAISTMNGITVNEQKVAGGCIEDGIIRLVAVAVLQKAHGYERCIKGLADYYQSKPSRRIEMHIVGSGRELNYYKRLVSRYRMEDYVTFYGKRLGDELDEVYENMDIALGIFGGYKKGIYVSSALKVREYLAKGLPVFSGCKEDVFSDESDCRYYFQVANDCSVIDMQNVIYFYDQIYGGINKKQDVRNEIREFAKKKIDIEVVMKPIIRYLRSS